LVHIFFGRRDTVPVPDPREVDSWRWVSVDDLRRDVMENGSHYTAWFKIYLDELSELLQAVLPTTAKG
jgi:isopentenyl-diphosphate delta-isomerase